MRTTMSQDSEVEFVKSAKDRLWRHYGWLRYSDKPTKTAMIFTSNLISRCVQQLSYRHSYTDNNLVNVRSTAQTGHRRHENNEHENNSAVSITKIKFKVNFKVPVFLWQLVPRQLREQSTLYIEWQTCRYDAQRNSCAKRRPQACVN